MKTYRWYLPAVVFLGFFLLSGRVEGGGFLGFLARREPDILTVTDVTDEGRSWPSPEPGKPVYYEAISFGTRNFPGLPGDPSPNPRAMLNLIVKTLAKQGFVRATKKGEAKVFLSIAWGYSRANLSALGFLGGDKLDLMWELESGPALSPNVLRRGFRGMDEMKIMEAANSDLYIASIQAFDLVALDAGTKKLLWHTRIACEATGITMADTMPTMIIAAGPFIGRETKKPVWRDLTDLRKANIDIGEVKMLEFVDPAASKAPMTK